jgi:hypothetical protein
LATRKYHSAKAIKYTSKYIAIILFVIITCCEALSMINSTSDLFDTIYLLSKQRPFDPKKIEEITGLVLQPIKNESNEFFSKYRSYGKSDKHDFVLSIELRTPTSKSSHSDGLLILYIKPEMCIRQDEIMGRFGLGEPEPGNPDMHPENALLYLNYRYSWGSIRFGIKYYDLQCLEHIVLDAIK